MKKLIDSLFFYNWMKIHTREEVWCYWEENNLTDKKGWYLSVEISESEHKLTVIESWKSDITRSSKQLFTFQIVLHWNKFNNDSFSRSRFFW